MTVQSGHRQLHVLYVAWGFPPCKSGGSFRAAETANALVEAGHRVTVLACDVGDLDRYAGIDRSTLEMVDEAIEIIRIPFDSGKGGAAPRRAEEMAAVSSEQWGRKVPVSAGRPFPEVIYGSWEEPLCLVAESVHGRDAVDVVVATGNPFVDFAAARYLNLKFSVPYVLDYRDGWSLQQFTGERRYCEKHPVFPVERDLLEGASAVWFVNDGMRLWYEEVYPACIGKTRVVSNGWDRAVVERLYREAGEGSFGRVRFGYVGTMTRSSPLSECLAGFRLVQSQQLSAGAHSLDFHGYLGFYAQPDVSMLEEIEACRGVGVSWKGPVAKGEIHSRYAECDVLVLCHGGAKYVTSGKVYEYVATGLPIVSVLDPNNGARDVLSGYPLSFPAASLDPVDIAEAFEAAAEAVRSGAATTGEMQGACKRFAAGYERRARLRSAVEEIEGLVFRHKTVSDSIREGGALLGWEKNPEVAVLELPGPTSRTIRMMSTLRSAGVTARSIVTVGGRELAVRAGLVVDVAPRESLTLRERGMQRIAELGGSEPGSLPRRLRSLEQRVATSDLLGLRPVWRDLAVMPYIWRDLAAQAVRSPAPVFWAADLDALPPAVWASAVCPGSRVIFDSHELFADLDYLDAKQRPYWREVAREFVPQADLVIAVGAAFGERLVLDYGARRVEVVQSLVPEGWSSGRDIRRHLGLSDDVPLVVHVGNVAENRNPGLAIDILRAQPDLHFVFLGEVRVDGLKDRFLRSSGEVQDRLHFVEPVPPEHLRSFIGSADATVILYSPRTSLNLELTMPNKLFDSLGAGLPVVVAAGGELARFVRESGLGEVFDDGDGLSAASAIRRVLDSDLRSRCKSRQRDFWWSSGEDRLVGLFGEQLELAQVIPPRSGERSLAKV